MRPINIVTNPIVCRCGIGMGRLVASGLLAVSTLIALGMSACVTEEVPLPAIHTSAYVTSQDDDAPSPQNAGTNANIPSTPAAQATAARMTLPSPP